MILSPILSVCEFIVVVVPDIIKLPCTVKLPFAVKFVPLAVNAVNSDDVKLFKDEVLAPIWTNLGSEIEPV